jgi:von Willebrand factor A domain-containing protein 8
MTDRTDEHGNTHWHLSPLVVAALEGNLAILDGIDRLTSDALSVLNTLINDRYG